MKLFHRHHWVAIAAHKLEMDYFTITGWPDEGTPVTEVLLKCACGDVRTKTITGHWTIEQISKGVS